MNQKSRLRRWFERGILLGVICMSWVFFNHHQIRLQTQNRTYTDVSAIPANDVGLVLGTSRRAYYGTNLYFKYRMEAAAELFLSGKVKHLIVSGDNHIKGYDEATDMRDYLVELGVPATAITCDYAGFRTLDSIVRCKKVFGQQKVTIISQAFHNERALFLADEYEMDAIAFNAKQVGKYKYPFREYLARAKAIIDVRVLHTSPRFLGTPVLLPV